MAVATALRGQTAKTGLDCQTDALREALPARPRAMAPPTVGRDRSVFRGDRRPAARRISRVNW